MSDIIKNILFKSVRTVGHCTKTLRLSQTLSCACDIFSKIVSNKVKGTNSIQALKTEIIMKKN